MKKSQQQLLMGLTNEPVKTSPVLGEIPETSMIRKPTATKTRTKSTLLNRIPKKRKKQSSTPQPRRKKVLERKQEDDEEDFDIQVQYPTTTNPLPLSFSEYDEAEFWEFVVQERDEMIGIQKYYVEYQKMYRDNFAIEEMVEYFYRIKRVLCCEKKKKKKPNFVFCVLITKKGIWMGKTLLDSI